MYLEIWKKVETTLYLKAFPSKVIAVGNKWTLCERDSALSNMNKGCN